MSTFLDWQNPETRAVRDALFKLFHVILLKCITLPPGLHYHKARRLSHWASEEKWRRIIKWLSSISQYEINIWYLSAYRIIYNQKQIDTRQNLADDVDAKLQF